MPSPLIPASLQRELGTVDTAPTVGGVWGDLYESTPELRFPFNLEIFDRMRTSDGQVRSIVRAALLPILSTNWRLQGSGVRDVVMQLCTADLGLQRDDEGRLQTREGQPSWYDLLRHILLHPTLGFAPLCRWYDVGTARQLAPDIKGLRGDVARLNLSPRMPRSISGFDVDDRGRLLGLRQAKSGMSYGGMQVIAGGGYGTGGGVVGNDVLIDRDHLVLFTNEQEGTNYAGQSILRSGYKNWLIKDALIRIGALSVDRQGMGVPVVTYPKDAGPGAREEALELARQVRAGEESGAALQEGWTMKILGVQGSVADALKWVEYHDQAASRSMLAMFLDLGHDNGARSLGDTFLDFFLLTEQALVKYIRDVITEQVIRPLVRVNFGPNEPYPVLVADDIRAEGAATAAALTSLTDAGLLIPDVDLRAHVRRDMGLPPEPEADGEKPSAAEALGKGPVGSTGRDPSELQRITGSLTNLVNAGFDRQAALKYLGLPPLALPEIQAPAEAQVPDEAATPLNPVGQPEPGQPVRLPATTPLRVAAAEDRDGTELALNDALVVQLPSGGFDVALLGAASNGSMAVEVHDDEDDPTIVFTTQERVLLLATGDRMHSVPAAVKAEIQKGIRLKATDKPTPSISQRLLSGSVSHADVVFLAGWFKRRERLLPSTGEPRKILHTDGKTFTKHGINRLLRGGEPGRSWVSSLARGATAASEGSAALAGDLPTTRAAEDAVIARKRAIEPAAKLPHRFRPARFTDPAGGRRCFLCGMNESKATNGRCPGIGRSAAAAELTYQAETEQIRQRRDTAEARRPHQFRPAMWTHPNGHPRCLLCGDEERDDGCVGSAHDGLQTSPPGSKGTSSPVAASVYVPDLAARLERVTQSLAALAGA